MKRTISAMVGKGSIKHNCREFHAENTDPARTKYNVKFCNEGLKYVYHELFDEAVAAYNAKQKRKDRKIDDYYEKIRTGKQEKLFHEVIIQIGNRDDMGAETENGELAKQILSEYMEQFRERNPNLRVFSAHLHMDEATPHLHIDFVPFVTGSQRGVSTRVTLKGALAAQGFKGTAKGDTEWSRWVESEKTALAEIMQEHGIEWEQKGTHREHLSVLDYKKQERKNEVEQETQKRDVLSTANKFLDAQIEEKNETLQELTDETEDIKAQAEEARKILEESIRAVEKNDKKVERMQKYVKKFEADVRVYDEDPEWQLPEPRPLMKAKNYMMQIVLPFVSKLKDVIWNLTLQVLNLQEENTRQKNEIARCYGQIDNLQDRSHQLQDRISEMEQDRMKLEYVKREIGSEAVEKMAEKGLREDRELELARRSRRRSIDMSL